MTNPKDKVYDLGENELAKIFDGREAELDALTHMDENGRPKMVEVSAKPDTHREAIAKGTIFMEKETLSRIKSGQMAKGDVLSVAQTAGIMAAKNTSSAIPMCHNIFISGVEMDFKLDDEKSCINIYAKVKTFGKTGIEMEALHAVSVAALTIYDMCKAVDKRMVISDIMLMKKTGGKSGEFIR